jgi:hypothetical protein
VFYTRPYYNLCILNKPNKQYRKQKYTQLTSESECTARNKTCITLINILTTKECDSTQIGRVVHCHKCGCRVTKHMYITLSVTLTWPSGRKRESIGILYYRKENVSKHAHTSHLTAFRIRGTKVKKKCNVIL